MFNNMLSNQIQSFLTNPANQNIIQQLLQSNPQLAQILQPQQTLMPVQQPIQQGNQFNSKIAEYDAKFNEYTNTINAITNELNSVKSENTNLMNRLTEIEGLITKP